MRAVECKSVRSEIDSADAGWQPQGRTQTHLSGCSECQRFHDRELKLRSLVSGLGTVEAPADFDFRLRARLANDKPRLVRGITVGGIAFGVPSLALASLIIVLGTVFLFRGMTRQPSSVAETNNPAPATVTDKGPTPPTGFTNPREGTTSAPKDNPGSGTLAVDTSRKPPRRKPAASSQRTVSEDFSNTPAKVIQHQASDGDQVAVFPIDAPAQSLKLSLDDVNGVSRTISLPRVSFGSQRFVAGESTTLIKASSKGVW